MQACFAGTHCLDGREPGSGMTEDTLVLCWAAAKPGDLTSMKNYGFFVAYDPHEQNKTAGQPQTELQRASCGRASHVAL